jgi:riboflavin biosynthesis pyrimidine reductase
MPHVSVNFAITADGKISGVARQPSGWTSAEDFARLIELRKPADALLVGRGTLTTDRMTLTIPDAPRQPLRCVVSRRGILAADLPIFSREGGAIHLLMTGDAEPDVPDGVTVHRGGLRVFLEMLERDHYVRHIHCEGGGELVKTLADDDLIDEIHLTWAGHTLFGGRDAPTITGVPGDFLSASRAFELTHFEPRADTGECFLTWSRIR